MLRHKGGVALLLLGLVGLLPVSGVRAASTEERLSVAQMAQSAEGLLGGMRKARDNAEAALRSAKSDGDLARVDCVSEALLAMKGVLRLAEDYQYDLQDDVKRSDAKGVESAYTKIKIASTKMDDLDGRVRSCGGPVTEGVADGEPVIEKAKDSDLPNLDPLQSLEQSDILIQHQITESPYL